MNEIISRVFGPREVAMVFGGTRKAVPGIYCNKDVLDKTYALGFDLVFFVDSDRHGPLSMKNMYSTWMYQIANSGIRLNMRGYIHEAFFEKEIPKAGWALVSRSLIEGSKGQNYLGETKAIASLLTWMIREDWCLPSRYEKALKEFAYFEPELQELLGAREHFECARRCATLQINQLCRERPVDTLYYFLLRLVINQESAIRGEHVRSNVCDRDGYIVSCTNGGADGWRIGLMGACMTSPRIGTRFILHLDSS